VTALTTLPRAARDCSDDCCGLQEEVDLEASMLENAVERWAGKMEEDWLWCGADEDAVSLSVVDSIFEDLIADSTIALLDGDSQRQVPSLSAYLSQCPCLYLFVAALLRPCVCVCLPSCCLRVCASVFAGSVDPSCARLPNVID